MPVSFIYFYSLYEYIDVAHMRSIGEKNIHNKVVLT